MRIKAMFGTSVCVVLVTCGVTSSAGAESSAVAKLLFCASGSIGAMPSSPPPGFESQFAEAVVEINSTSDMRGLAVSAFSLVDRAGNETAFKRVVSIENFNELAVLGEGSFAFYLHEPHAGGTQLWNGTLLGGMTHLRIRVAMPQEPIAPVRCRLRMGPYTFEGPYDGSWPT